MKKYVFQRINEFPKTSGIYYFYNKHGEILYVGKATTLQGRMRNHSHNFWIMSKFIEGKDLCMNFLNKTQQGIFDEDLFLKIKHFESDLNYRLNFNMSAVNVDFVLDFVDYVNIIEMNKEKIDIFETNEITRLEPPYNSQSENILYDEALERYWELSANFGHYFDLVKNSKK